MEQVGYSDRILLLYISNEVSNTFSNLSQAQKDHIAKVSFDYIKSDNSKMMELHELDNNNYINLIEEIKRILSEKSVKYIPHEAHIKTNIKMKRNPKWTKREDLRLLCGTIKYDAKNWRAISAFVGFNRTSGQCNQRWNRSVCPEILHTKWTESEDKILLNLVDVQKFSKWKQVSKFIPGRTDLQCRYRYSQLTKSEPELNHETESNEQDISIPPAEGLKIVPLPDIGSLDNSIKMNSNVNPLLMPLNKDNGLKKVFVKSVYKKIILKPENLK